MADVTCEFCGQGVPLGLLRRHKSAHRIAALDAKPRAELSKCCRFCRRVLPASQMEAHLTAHRIAAGTARPANTSAFRARRLSALKRADYRCQQCGKPIGLAKRDWQWHHGLTGHPGGDPDIVLCSQCHTAITNDLRADM